MSTIKVDTIATRTGSGNITASNDIAGTSATLSGTLGVTGNTTVGGTLGITGETTTANITTGNTSIITAGRFISSQTSNDPWFKGVNSSNTETLFIKKDGQIYSAFGLSVGGTGDANTLDDYEEGTWNPTVTRSSSAPSLTYQRQHGTYVKVGRSVFCSFNLYATSISGGSGNFLVGGLPFTTNSTLSNGSEGYRPIMYFGYFAGASGSTTPRGGLVNGNTNHATLYQHGGSDARSNYSQVSSTLGSSLNIYGSVTYISQT